ncbi:MAG: chromosome segregation protein SMC [Oscillospiraceae bacterium]|nr:chromosome segregation protein SMC [Oscillospiraceae bacterium]
MYLKALTIQGFKSFPDKTVLTFDHDITAIVGPNGSGKSNISDAIRWVMGEQSSKSLRGSKMEDVIFGGTQKRTQLGFAEVSLILDNSDGALSWDGSEVMVTRRYYRSGESEYFINRESARLRDITDLFLNTGMGREGYSNIGQGRIDEILSVKSTDRREIFEEAAGIAKFRHRKEETERRLASTEDNLIRIGDKISELELQLEPLKKQAEQARKYIALRDELRGLEVTVWLNQLTELSERAEKAATDHAASAGQLDSAHRELDRLYAEAERMAGSLHEKDLALDALREAISQAEAEEQRCIGEQTILENNLKNSRDNIARIQSELSDQDNRTGSLKKQIEDHQAHIAQLLQQMGAEEANLKHAQAESQNLSGSAESITARLLDERARQAELLRKTSELLTQEASSKQLADELSDRITQLDEQERTALEQHGRLEHEAGQADKELSAARESATTEGNRVEGFTLRLKSRADKRDSLREKRTALQLELDTTQSKIRMYQEMERDYDGYSRAVREVMQASDQGKLGGIRGPVTRLLQVDTKFAPAIETALGQAAQNIVARTDADGKRVLDYLKRTDSGRVTVLPMNVIRSNLLQEKNLDQMPGYLGLGSQLVRFDEQYRAIVENLLGRTVVVDDLDHAMAMARKYSNRFRIVTLDSQVMNVGGSMTGGSAAKNSGLLLRAGALRELQAKQEKLTGQLGEVDQQLQEAERLTSETEYELQIARDLLRKAEDDVLRLEGDCRQYAAVLAAADDAIARSSEEKAAILQRLNQARESLSGQSDELETLRKETESCEAAIDALLKDQDALTQQTDEISQKINEIMRSAAALEAERTASDHTVSQLRSLEAELQGDRTQREALLSQFEEEARRNAEQIERSVEQIRLARERTEERKQALSAALEERRQVEAEKTTLDRQTQEQNRQILGLERETARLEQRKTTSELEQNQIIDRLWDSYSLTPSTAEEERVEIESMQDATRKISSLKQRINALGTPNLGAIEEYDRVDERYSYLSGQRDDVLASKRDLIGIIESITGEMTSIFTTQFAKINECFGQIFREMFGGGSGSLVLEDPDHPLECGIEIRVQPPGKQLKTITLLSGGEKAFVAIALYFSILRVHPTPFCMLDEIDAALDERNVVRFATYLRNLCKDTQFIVITHRRGTMEEADMLYGVTMQEQGVSKMLSVSLNELQAELGIE